MAVQGRDVIFEFKDSCNCCWWRRPLQKEDPVFVCRTGTVVKFDFSKKPSADVNAQRTLQNIQACLDQLTASQAQLQAILMAIQHQMNLDIQHERRILKKAELERIEQIAIPLLRQSPEPAAPHPSPHHLQVPPEEYPATPPPGQWPLTPKHSQRQQSQPSQLVRSPAMKDIRADSEHSEAVVEEYFVIED